MKAWVIEEAAGGNRLAWQDVDEPVPGDGELLIGVRAAGLNRADLMRRAGHYERIPLHLSAPIAGMEAAGEVLAVGPHVTGFAVGDRVMGMPAGAYAEKALIHARLAMHVPDALDWEAAAALPAALLTAHDALVTRGRLRAGDAVLVHGASTGVGIAALQIARELRAGVVAGTAGSPEKLAALSAFGLTHAINHRSDDIAARALSACGDGADVIVDMVGAQTAEATLHAAAIGARWVQVGRLGGKVASLDLDVIARKRIELIGVTFRTRTAEEVSALITAAVSDLWAAVAAQRIAMPIAARFGLDEADRAQELMRSNQFLGKIVLKA